MLVEFRVENYKSIREQQVLSMVASKDTSLSSNTVDIGKLKLLRSAAIYGPNASGKSNLLNAFYLMSWLVEMSADLKLDEKLPVSPFLFDANSRKKPCSFEATFFVDNVRFQYGFSLSSSRFLNEWLLAYPKGHAQKWFVRSFNKKKGDYEWDWGSHQLKGERVRLSKLTRSNALFLSVAAKLANEQVKNVYRWFADRLRPISPHGLPEFITAEMVARGLEDDKRPGISPIDVAKFIHQADPTILDINVKRKPKEEVNHPNKLIAGLKKLGLGKYVKHDEFKIEFMHRTNSVKQHERLSLDDESDGTRKMFAFAGPWLQSLNNGYILLVDEMETSLHPLLCRTLVNFFQDISVNKNNAQLIFATHNTTLLDPNLFRRDQIYFTDRDELGATHLYSLSDYKEKHVRKGEAMQRGYLSGRYGAIPIIKAFEGK